MSFDDPEFVTMLSVEIPNGRVFTCEITGHFLDTSAVPAEVNLSYVEGPVTDSELTQIEQELEDNRSKYLKLIEKERQADGPVVHD